jgi:hypothetical protein
MILIIIIIILHMKEKMHRFFDDEQAEQNTIPAREATRL